MAFLNVSQEFAIWPHPETFIQCTAFCRPCLRSILKISPPCTGFVLFPHQLTFNLDEVFPFYSRKLTFQYTNRASTNQKYCREPEKWCALYHCFLVLVAIYIPFASPVDILTWPYSSLLGCYLQGFWFGLPQNISGRDVECGRAAGGYSYGRSNRYGDDEI